MQGFLLTFFSAQDRRVAGRPVASWLLDLAQRLGIGGGTVLAASEGMGHDRRLHMARFFELADQPLEVQFVVSAAQADALMAVVAQADVRLFYTRTPLEYGVLGQQSEAA